MYDTIVIGNDLSSLVAAAMVSHHGRQTVLVSEGDARHVYTDYGYTFNIDPAPLSGFGPAQTCSRLLANLGMPVTELSGLQLLNPGLQIILSDHRIDCFNGLEELLHDMEREFSGEKDEIRKLYASVLKISNIVEQTTTEKPFICPTNFAEFISALTRMPLILKEKLLLSRRFKAISNNPSLARVFETKIAVLSNWCNKESRPVSVASAYALSSPLKGLYHHIAGNEVLPGLLKTAFESSGGHLIKDCTVMRIDINEKIDVDVSIPDKLSQISGQYLIASTKWEKLRLLLLSDRKFRRMERRLKLARSAYYPFTLHMGILERCVPEKTAIYVAIVIDENRPVMDDNLVFVEISAKDCEGRAPAGKRALSATIFLKESPLVLTNDELKEVSQVVFCALEKFFPFLRENLDFLDIGMSIELSRKSQELVNHKYAMQSGSFFGMSGISNKTPHRNVFMTGGMLLAGLGFQGEIISGINAANLVISKERERMASTFNDFIIWDLGERTIPSPVNVSYYTHDSKRILHNIYLEHYKDMITADGVPLSLEVAGPRERIFFDPAQTKAAIVTCGGLCPGINDVIRAIFMELFHRYGVKNVVGIKYGFQGLIPKYGHQVLELTPDIVKDIHTSGGSILSSSRGMQDSAEMVNTLKRMNVDILFCIGGDGTMRGAGSIADEIARRKLHISVIGIPKTIDNDLNLIQKTFGFDTAISEAVKAIECAHAEAKGAPMGIGLVKIMGRESGHIACGAALAQGDVNFVLIPEVHFDLQGDNGFLISLENRLRRSGHCVILVAEGAGQELIRQGNETVEKDASGNIRLLDIGTFLKIEIEKHLKKTGFEINLKYIDPSYMIRSVPANASDSIYCGALGQYAVHAGMSGKTSMLVGLIKDEYVHLPLQIVTSGSKVNPEGNIWMRVLETTGQPPSMKA